MAHRVISKTILAAVAFVCGATVLCVSAQAGVQPGDVITAQTAEKVQDLVSPGVYYMVRHDMRMHIVPSERVDWPPPYKEATEKYSAQVRLTADHRSLIGYAAGQPFPLIERQRSLRREQDHLEQRFSSSPER